MLCWESRSHACTVPLANAQTRVQDGVTDISRRSTTTFCYHILLFGGCRPPATLSQDERLKKLEATLDKLAQKSFRWQEARGGWEALPLMLHLSEGS